MSTTATTAATAAMASMETSLSNNQTSGERRKVQRAKRAAMVACLKGKTYATENWSMGGFLLDNYDGSLSTGALVNVEGLGHSKKKLLSVNLPARVERLGETCIVVSYLGLDAKAYEFLQQSMSDSGDMRILVEN